MAHEPAAAATVPRPPLALWTLLVDDDSFVNVPHLLRYASRFDPDAPLLVGHVLDGIWPGGRGFSGGAGMLLSRVAARRFGRALASGQMPLPPRGVPNDEHIATWARKLGVACVHSNLFWYSALPADARIVSVVASRLGRDASDYTDRNSVDGIKRRDAFATAAVRESNGALDAQILGAVVVHRIPEQLMRTLHWMIESQRNHSIGGSGGGCAR